PSSAGSRSQGRARRRIWSCRRGTISSAEGRPPYPPLGAGRVARGADMTRTVAVEVALLPNPGSEGTDSARAEALVESYRRLAAVFHEVLSEQSPDALLGRIADALGDLVPYQDLHIYRADGKRSQLVPVFAAGKWAEKVLASPIEYGQGITGWAVEHRSPVLTNEAHLDPRVSFVPGTPPDPEAP